MRFEYLNGQLYLRITIGNRKFIYFMPVRAALTVKSKARAEVSLGNLG